MDTDALYEIDLKMVYAAWNFDHINQFEYKAEYE
jgi:hypothetical protein